jgi:hypothetical protein
MSVNGSGSDAGLSPRATRVRNRCLAVLAARRSLPTPSAQELNAIDGKLGLRAAFEQWEKLHTPPIGVATIAPVQSAAVQARRMRWRSPRIIKSAAVAAAGLAGLLAGDLWRQRVGAQESIATVEQRWLPVNDSVAASVNRTILAAMRDRGAGVSLSAADLATMIFRSPRRRSVPVDSLEARMDSLLWIRGRLRRGSRFELGGNVVMLRRGLAELRVKHLNVDGVATDSTMVSRLVAGPRSRSVDVDRLRFEVPSFVSSIFIAGGAAEVSIRDR